MKLLPPEKILRPEISSSASHLYNFLLQTAASAVCLSQNLVHQLLSRCQNLLEHHSIQADRTLLCSSLLIDIPVVMCCCQGRSGFPFQSPIRFCFQVASRPACRLVPCRQLRELSGRAVVIISSSIFIFYQILI